MNTATLAVAGSRKTQSIVDACSGGQPGVRRLVLTYTLTGQRDLALRLQKACPPGSVPEVMGWYSFLLRHWVKPFLTLKYPGRRLGGLNFDGSPAMTTKGYVIATGQDRFLDEQSRAYKRFLSKLAVDVADASQGTVISRLQRIYGEIYIDEVQDLTGYDLDVLEQLLNSTSTIRLVGDFRQSVFDTNPQDPRHPKFRGLGMLDWFEEQREAGRLDVTHSSETWRSVQPIATFSDSLFDSSLKFPATVSNQKITTDHDGVYVIAPAHVAEYLATYQPVCLRQAVTTQVPDGVTATNFGVSKGLTHDRVLIFTTDPIRKFLTKGKPLSDRSACGLYVAVTRAVHSVAFVMDNPEKASVPTWIPRGHSST